MDIITVRICKNLWSGIATIKFLFREFVPTYFVLSQFHDNRVFVAIAGVKEIVCINTHTPWGNEN